MKSWLTKKLDSLWLKVIELWRKFVKWLRVRQLKVDAKSAKLKLFECELHDYFSEQILTRDVVEVILRRLQMPASIVVGGNGAKAIFTEFSGLNGSGSVLPNAGPVQFSSSNGAVATVDSQGNVSAIGAGSATITGLDTVNNLSASDTINVQGGVSAGAQSATLVLSAN